MAASHGPSGLDTCKWRPLLTSYKSSSIDFCKTVSKLSIRIATEYNGCRLIALDKCPGVRPIDIDGVLRRITGRSTVKCVKRNLQLLGGTYRCALVKRVPSNMLSIHSGGAFLKIVLKGSYSMMPGTRLIA